MTEMEHKLGGYKIYSRDDAAALFAGRDLYVWGAGQKGRGFLGALARNGFTIKAFLDNSPALKGGTYHDIPIIAPDKLLSDPAKCATAFILCATIRRRYLEMFAACEAAGLRRGVDFTNIQTLAPYCPSVEICGNCNLHCLACPRSNPEHSPAGGLMTAEAYRAILEKLVREQPFTYVNSVYLWAEPLLNPQLADMIRVGHTLGVATDISTNLNACRKLADVMRARPGSVRVALSGFGPANYERTHTGASWETVRRNMDNLAEYVEEYADADGRTLVQISFHVNRRNVAEIEPARKMCVALGFDFFPHRSVVFTDHVMDMLDGKSLSADVQEAMDIMPRRMSAMLDDAHTDRDKVCLLKRCAPTINWNGDVLTCCNYAANRDGNSMGVHYLGTTLPDIVQRRMESPLCAKCLSHNLHRYFVPEFECGELETIIAGAP